MESTILAELKEKKTLDDKKLSMAIMSSTVILTIQYFFLVVLGLMDTSTGSILQTFSKVVVATIFLYTFPIVLKEHKMKLLITYFVSVFILLSHFLFFSNNRQYIEEILFPFFFMCLPVFVYAVSLKDWSVLKRVMRKASIIVFVCGFFLTLTIFTGIAKIDNYSMAFSYYMLLPSILFIDELLDRFSIKAIFISSVSVVSILAIGSRGALLCIAVFIILKLIDPTAPKRMSKVRGFFICAFISIAAFTLVNLQTILLFLYKWLMQFGLSSRSLKLLMSGDVYLSGRDDIYGKVLAVIRDNPILGVGITGDRALLNGTYSHNIFLEILVNYGVLIGSFVIIFLFTLIVGIFFVKDPMTYNLSIIWISIGFVSLFVSGSYLTDLSFWTFLGVMLSAYFFKGKRELSDDAVVMESE
ncbi:MAG TPA: O-antigen ligase family protein [Ureibacillus sp.]|nr:O-antigen ligase family protein [Ureibacillus sp.]